MAETDAGGDVALHEGGDGKDDHIEASRAPLIEHLSELRTRLIIIVAAIGVAFIGCFLVSRPVFDFLVEPFRKAAEGRDFTFIFTAPFEFLIVQLRIAFYGAIGVAFPVIAWQLYAFIAPGLYKTEQKAVLPFLLAAPLLFTAGAALAYFVVFPFLADFVLSFETVATEGAPVEHLPKVSEYVSMEAALIVAFGLGFQLPVVIGLLARAGMVTAKGLRKARKYAVVGVFAFSAFATPADPLSQFALAIPLYVLYEVSIWVAWLTKRRREKEDAATDDA